VKDWHGKCTITKRRQSAGNSQPNEEDTVNHPKNFSGYLVTVLLIAPIISLLVMDAYAVTPSVACRKDMRKLEERTTTAIAKSKKPISMLECLYKAEQGDVRAQFDLGLRYAKGRGIPRDDREARYWYRKAAEQQDMRAQLNLGIMCLMGRGAPRNAKVAFEWCKKSAVNGLPEAQATLGGMYEKGVGVKADIIRASVWYKRAADQGFGPARARLRAILPSILSLKKHN
jgi:TPR repeat protein